MSGWTCLADCWLNCTFFLCLCHVVPSRTIDTCPIIPGENSDRFLASMSTYASVFLYSPGWNPGCQCDPSMVSLSLICSLPSRVFFDYSTGASHYIASHSSA